jgi:hypothetical protein
MATDLRAAGFGLHIKRTRRYLTSLGPIRLGRSATVLVCASPPPNPEDTHKLIWLDTSPVVWIVGLSFETLNTVYIKETGDE